MKIELNENEARNQPDVVYLSARVAPEFDRLVEIAVANVRMKKKDFLRAAIAWFLGEKRTLIGDEFVDLDELCRRARAAVAREIAPLSEADKAALAQRQGVRKTVAVPSKTPHATGQ